MNCVLVALIMSIIIIIMITYTLLQLFREKNYNLFQ